MADIPSEIREAITNVLDYAQPDEERDWAEQDDDGHGNHIVLAMRTVRDWLEREC